MFGNAFQDIRYALRQLRKSPGFTLTAVITISLSIGANAAIFSMIHAILLRQLPFDAPSRVLVVDSLGMFHGFRDMRTEVNASAQSFSTIEAAAMYAVFGVNAELKNGSAERLTVAETGAQFLRVLGVHPNLGRDFAGDEDIPGRDRVALISDRLWREKFNANSDAVGSTIRLNGAQFVVIGVLHPKMDFPANTDLWAPTIFDMNAGLIEGNVFMPSFLVRMRSGLTLDAVRAEFAARVALQGRPRNKDSTWMVPTPVADELTKSIRNSLWMLALAVFFVLLIACSNVAAFMLARTEERRGEFAVRAALGAAPGRLVRQQLTESVLIALAGGVLGVAVAHFLLQLIYAMRPAILNGFPRPAIDLTVLVFSASLAVATGLAFGIAPAWAAGSEDPADALRVGAWRASPHSMRLRTMLVAGQMGVAFALLVGAGLLIRTTANISRVPLGFRVDHILTFSVALHGQPYVQENALSPAVEEFYSSALGRLAAIPGVNAAAMISTPPLDKKADMLIPVRDDNANQATINAAPRLISGGYFSALGIRFIDGRDFSTVDTRASRRVVILSQDLANRLWPGRNPIGQTIQCPFIFCKEPPVVIGVVSPNRRFGPRSDSIPEFYLPYTQMDWPSMTFILRTHGDPAALVPAALSAIAAVDPSQPIIDIETMRDRLNDKESLVRLELFALCAFAFLSVLLVAIGLFGVISYSVARRTREIGIRIAVGASRTAVLKEILRESAVIAIAGAGIGMVLSLAFSRLLSASLFGVTAYDTTTLGVVLLAFMVLAMLASYLPARRAASIEPMQALRTE
jgi:predicted permease